MRKAKVFAQTVDEMLLGKEIRVGNGDEELAAVLSLAQELAATIPKANPTFQVGLGHSLHRVPVAGFTRLTSRLPEIHPRRGMLGAMERIRAKIADRRPF